MSSRRFRLVNLVCALSLFGTTFVTAEPVPIVNTIGDINTATTFSTFGSGGLPIFAQQPYGSAFWGPQFTLTRPSVLTSAGAYVNNCESIMAGIPQCNWTLPLTLEIRPALPWDPFGPDPSRLIAAYVLSNDNDPLTVSFESASFRLLLEAGTYFALFAPAPGQGGGILQSAQDPFLFRAGSTTFGVIDPVSGFSLARQEQGAVMVTAAPIPEPSTVVLLLAGGVTAALRARRRAPVHGSA